MWAAPRPQYVGYGVRPVTPRPAAPRPAATVAKVDDSRYSVYTEGNDGEEFVIQTLAGEFLENGSNHDRPTYQKVAAKAGASPPEVFLYYWDGRDGPSFEGWWFGKSVGGNEVWSHNQSKGMKPPQRGWKIPFAGTVRQSFVVMSKVEQQRAEQKAGAKESLKQLQDDAAALISEATAGVEHARTIAGEAVSTEALDEADQVLAPLAASLASMQKRLEAGQITPGPGVLEVRAALAKLRAVQTSVNQEIQKTRIARPRIVQKKKAQEAEARDAVALKEMIDDAAEKANGAEDMVERTVITYEGVDAAGEDAGEAKRAAEETQELANQAQLRIKEALALIGRKMVTVKNLESEATKEKANADLNALRAKLREANQKLTPLLNVKQEFQQRAAAKKIVQEVNDKLAPAELDVDRAAEAAEPLLAGGSWPSKAIMKQAETAINVASDKLQGALKLLELRLKPSAGLIKRELEKVELRARAAEKRLGELRNAHRRFHEREASSNLLSDVGEKMKVVQEAVRKLEEVLGPYLMGVEQMSTEESQESIQAGDEAMKGANKATAAARIVISMRLVEVKRFTAEAGQEAQKQLQDYQKQLEAAMSRVGDLRSAIAERKLAVQRAEALTRVEAVEALVTKVTANGALIADEEKLKELSWSEIRAAGDATRTHYLEALEVMKAAQQVLTARQIEAKNSDDAEESAELARLQQRLRSAQAKIAPYKMLPPAVEKQIAAKKMIDEAVGKVTAAEEKMDQAIALIDGLGEASPEEGAAAEAGGGKGVGKAKKPMEAASMAAGNAALALKGILRYLEVQAKTGKVPQDEAEKLQERVKAGQERLDAALQAMREGSDKLAARGLLQEVEQQVRTAEEAVEKYCEASAPLLKEAASQEPQAPGEADGADAGVAALAASLKVAEQAAAKALGGSKTIIAVKKIAAKRLSEGAARASAEELDALQGRVDAAMARLVAVKKESADKKCAKARGEAVTKFAAAEEKVRAAVAAAEAACGGAAGDPEASEVQEAVEKAGKAQQEAQAAVSEVRSLLQGVLRDLKAGESAAQLELSQLLVKVGPLQAELDKQRKTLSEREQKFVAARLLKDATALLEDLETKLERATTAAAPLVGEEKEDFSGAMLLGQAVEALRAHAKKASKTKEGLFDDIRGSDAGISEASFVSFMQALPELKELEGAAVGEAQLKAAYKRLDSIGGGQVAARQFLDQFRLRYACVAVAAVTDHLAIEGGKVIRKLAPHEVVEALSEPAKDEATGLLRLKVRAEKDDIEGFVALAGNQGTVYLEPFSPYVACLRQTEDGLQETLEAVNQTMAHLKQRAEELGKKPTSGPLGEAKAELQKMRMRAGKAQAAHAQLKKKVAEAQKGHAQQLEADRKKREEAAEKAKAATMMQEATELADGAAAEAEKCAATADVLASAEAPVDGGNPLEAMEEAARRLEEAERCLSKALRRIMKDNMDEIRTVQQGPFVEARRLMFRLKVRLNPLEARCKKSAAALQAARGRIASAAEQAVSAALRASAQEAGLGADALFSKLSQGGSHVPAIALRAHLEALEGAAKPQASQLDLGLHRYAAGVTRLGLLGMLQEYKRCVKEIALTTAFEVKSSSTLRKLEREELVEVLAGSGRDEATGLERVKCRALRDLAEGWATLRGNQGTAFLEAAPKPYLLIGEAASSLQRACESCSEEVCALEPGEVLEVLEGPRREPPIEVVRLRGKAKRDGKGGWVTLKDGQHSSPSFELAKIMLCKGSIALTDGFDIASCTALRKLEVGEMLEQLEAPREDEARKLMRVHVKAKSDGKEGWATMKGNQGTVYILESYLHNTCRRSVPLESSYASGSKVVRTIDEGEMFEVLEGPSTEVKEGAMRARGRSLRSGSEGWFTVAQDVLPWAPSHTCRKATELRDGADHSSARALRSLEEGEVVEALEGPISAGEAGGALQLRVRAERDGSVGFASLRGAKGEVLLQPVVDLAPAGAPGAAEVPAAGAA